MEYDPRDGERYRRRLKKQRNYQSEYRKSLEEDGIPERDDIAAATLRVMLNTTVQNPDRVNGWIQLVAKNLAEGKEEFDCEAVERTIQAMVDRHAKALKRQERRQRRR